jgi:hypothetical protein
MMPPFFSGQGFQRQGSLRLELLENAGRTLVANVTMTCRQVVRVDRVLCTSHKAGGLRSSRTIAQPLKKGNALPTISFNHSEIMSIISSPPSFPQGVFPTMITPFTGVRHRPQPHPPSHLRSSAAAGSVDVPVLQALTEW